MIARIETWLRTFRRKLSHSEWGVRRWRLPCCEQSEADAGLLIVYLDNIYFTQLQQPLAASHWPFLSKLQANEGYRLQPLDIGAGDAATVHRELFFGRTAHFANGNNAEGNNATDADRSALLTGGSQYGGRIDGGATESHFVAPPSSSVIDGRQSAPLDGVERAAGNKFPGAAWRVAHATGRLGLETLLVLSHDGESCADAATWSRQPSIARMPAWGDSQHQLSTFGASVDLARGLPIVHVSLRAVANSIGAALPATGPRRREMRAVDRVLRRLWGAARSSLRREYDVWIYGLAADGEGLGFVLLPPDAPVANHPEQHLQPWELRDAALHVLGRAPLPDTARPFVRPQRETLRIMTYNAHSCRGVDGKLSPARIARVIALCDPDVVALQELDVGRARTGGVDQAEAIARELKMEFHFHPAISLEEERYGDAILSRFPLTVTRADALPGLPGRPDLEPRGALWVAVQTPRGVLQLINTHLGLVAAERLRQAEALLGPDWLADPRRQGPTVLCGDFNALPSSRVCRRLNGPLRDAQLLLPGHRPKNTFFSRFPVGRIDHVLVSVDLKVVAIEVPQSEMICRASDHLPLVVEVKMP